MCWQLWDIFWIKHSIVWLITDSNRNSYNDVVQFGMQLCYLMNTLPLCVWLKCFLRSWCVRYSFLYLQYFYNYFVFCMRWNIDFLKLSPISSFVQIHGSRRMQIFNIADWVSGSMIYFFSWLTPPCFLSCLCF